MFYSFAILQKRKVAFAQISFKNVKRREKREREIRVVSRLNWTLDIGECCNHAVAIDARSKWIAGTHAVCALRHKHILLGNEESVCIEKYVESYACVNIQCLYEIICDTVLNI